MVTGAHLAYGGAGQLLCEFCPSPAVHLAHIHSDFNDASVFRMALYRDHTFQQAERVGGFSESITSLMLEPVGNGE